jgi:hypothetical protein
MLMTTRKTDRRHPSEAQQILKTKLISLD